MDVLSKPVYLKGITNGVWGRSPQLPDAVVGLRAKPPAAGQFFVSF